MQNSAVIVTVTPEDFGTEDVLSGVAFQQKLEEAATMPEMEDTGTNCLVIFAKTELLPGQERFCHR